jgi:hypothetical protein
MNPEQILAAMAEVYATCTSYRDAGRVVTRFIDRGGRVRTSIRPFTTAFVRPDRFRFEYRDRFGEGDDEWERHLVWAEGGWVRTWWDVTPGVEEPESLGLALAGATGVSGGSAHTISSLILPEMVGGSRLTDLADVVSLGDVELNGVVCYRLRGNRVLPSVDPVQREREHEELFRATGVRLGRVERDPVTAWIDRGTLLVRRMEEGGRFDTFRTESLTEYEPEVGVTITDDELRFDPPG